MTEGNKNRRELDDDEDEFSEDPVRNMTQVNSPDDLYNHYK